ncbi:MAG: hypothetical protein HQL80_11670, partial [Magnetococcales bacterium]|nr:hypothetical protein [Magnetococcales bacterium]
SMPHDYRNLHPSQVAGVPSESCNNAVSPGRIKQVIHMGLRCALGGAAGGAGLVLMKFAIDGEIGHVAGWTIEGLIMGWLLAPVFPNLPREPALFGGMMAGFLGALIGPFLVLLFGSSFGIAVADSLKGFFLGAVLTIAEKYHAISNGSLVVHWGMNETSTILLGEEPIAIGSDPKCQIYLKKDGLSIPDVVAEISISCGKIILNDKKNKRVSNLADRTIINVGTIKIEVKAGVPCKKSL